MCTHFTGRKKEVSWQLKVTKNEIVAPLLRRHAQSRLQRSSASFRTAARQYIVLGQIQAGGKPEKSGFLPASVRAAHTRPPLIFQTSITSSRVQVYLAFPGSWSSLFRCSSLTLMTGLYTALLVFARNPSFQMNVQRVHFGTSSGSL